MQLKKNEKQIERERERERDVTFFCVRKLCIKWKRTCQIYSNMLKIRTVKIKEDKR